MNKKGKITQIIGAVVNDNVYSIGGRVFNVTSVGDKFLNIRKKIISIIKKINWKNGFYRKDIGWRVVNSKWELLVENLKVRLLIF